MKSVYYCLAVALLALASFSLVMSRSPEDNGRADISPSPRQVYVNLNVLAAAHPAASAAAEMKSMAGMTEPAMPTTRSARMPQPGSRSVVVGAQVDRRALEDELAQSAVRALSRLESERQQALEARVRASRETLFASAESEMEASKSDIEKRTDEQIRQLALKYRDPRVRAELAIGSLQTAVKTAAASKDGPAQLKAAQDELRRIDAAYALDEQKIRQNSASEIDRLRRNSTDKIDAVLVEKTKREQFQIEQEIAQARNAIFQDLGRYSSAAAQSNSLRNTAVTVAPISVRQAHIGPGAEPVAEATDTVASRIRQDVAETVRKLAKEQGVTVTFERHAGVPDMTQQFAEAIRDRGWTLCGPVLAGDTGS